MSSTKTQADSNSYFSNGRPLYLEVDGPAFQHNVQRVAALVSNTPMMLVLKANAYGHGLVEMARLAGKHDIAVAVPEEMRCLREASISNRVWVLEGPFSEQCIKHSEDVVWVVHSLWQLDLLERCASGKSHQVCLKLDTGMNRLGMSLAEFSSAQEFIQLSKGLSLYACMTHFSASDLPEGGGVSKQVERFEAALQSCSVSNALSSTANSGGILYYPNSHKDIVRPGIVLYGAMPAPKKGAAKRFGFKSVMSFNSAVIAIRSIKKGDAVGYGGRWVAERDSRIATVAGGYGDGYPRNLPDGTPVAVYDTASQAYIRAPLVGRVSMDMLTVDITDIPSCELGTPVELWGKHIDIDELAMLSGTIAYELLCGVTARVPRCKAS